MRRFWMQVTAIVAATCGLMAADAVWRIKPPSQWTEADALQILARSPWSGEINATITRRLTEEQLRDGGQMGQPQGVGNAGVDAKGSGPRVSANVFTGLGGGDRSQRSLPQPVKLRVRWESALPVRLAELKSHTGEPPTLAEEGYRIAVYGIPSGGLKGDPEELGKPLRGLAALKRQGKRDVRPVSAEVFQLADGAAVVYVFPFSAELSKSDGEVRLEAQIGRIVLAQSFDMREMEFRGKLEL